MQETGQRIDQARKVTASFCVYDYQEEGAYGIKTLSQIGERCIWEGTVNERRDGNTSVVPDTEKPYSTRIFIVPGKNYIASGKLNTFEIFQ